MHLFYRWEEYHPMISLGYYKIIFWSCNNQMISLSMTLFSKQDTDIQAIGNESSFASREINFLKMKVCLLLSMGCDRNGKDIIGLSYLTQIYLSILVYSALYLTLFFSSSLYLSIYLSIYHKLSLYISIHISLFIYLSIYLSSSALFISLYSPLYILIFLSISLFTSACLSIYLTN